MAELLAACAARGFAQAQAMLGLLYQEGKHIAQDHAKARRWFMHAAQGGNPLAQTWLGDVLSREEPVDREGAVFWYERAAQQGHAGAIPVLTA